MQSLRFIHIAALLAVALSAAACSNAAPAGQAALTPGVVPNRNVACGQIQRRQHKPVHFAFLPDQQTDHVCVYDVDGNGAMSPLNGPYSTGTGPQGITVAQIGSATFLYVLNQGSNNISAYQVDLQNGTLSEISGSPFSAGSTPIEAAFVTAGANSYLYVTDSGSNAVSGYSIDSSSGALTQLQGSPFSTGEAPTGISAISIGSASYLYVANNTSNNISGFTINASTGALTSLSGSPFATGLLPVAAATIQKGSTAYLYVTNYWYGTVSGYSINGSTGALTPVAGSPFKAYGAPQEIAVGPIGSGNYGAYLADYGDELVDAFTIDMRSGVLTAVSGTFRTNYGPFAVDLIQSNHATYLYVTCIADGYVSGYQVNPVTGGLKQLGRSPFRVDGRDYGIATVAVSGGKPK